MKAKFFARLIPVFHAPMPNHWALAFTVKIEEIKA